MTEIVHGSSVTWVTLDRDRTISAAIQWMLRDAWKDEQVRLEIYQATTWDEASQFVDQHPPGLLTLMLTEPDFSGACKVLQRARSRRPECLRIVVTDRQWARSDSSLGEAGAQLVVSGIPYLQRLVPHLATRVPRKAGGYHPLTAGLVERLPWG